MEGLYWHGVAIQERGHKALYAAAGVLAAVLLFMAGGRLMLSVLERQLIYFPSKVSRDAPTPRVSGASTVEEVWLQASDGVRIHGIYAATEDAVVDLLFFHGNAGNLYDRLDNVEGLLRAGFNVFIIDYRGFGKSEGEPSEDGLYKDGMAAYEHLTQSRAVDPTALVLFGRSLGSSVAIELATERPAAAVIIESGFTSAQDIARIHYPWVPGFVRRAMTHQLSSLSKVGNLRTPALYVHGDRDTIVPMQMGRQLFEATPEPKAWYEIAGAGHNDTWYVGGQVYFRRLSEFVRTHVAADR